MRLKTCLTLVVSMQILFAYATDIDHLCLKSNLVRKTRYTPQTVLKTFTRRNWIGFMAQDRRFVTEYKLEYFWDRVMIHECCQGYVNNSSGCVPFCRGGCPAHSRCIAPYICSCEAGYTRMGNGTCAPICTNGCPVNAYCQQPETCACRTGYDRHNDPHTNTEQCVPRCSNACPVNGVCVAPEECQCLPGYSEEQLEEHTDPLQPGAVSLLTRCTPACAERCPAHSSCLRPNECVCELGYLMQRLPQHQPYCEAQCAQDCSSHGKCVAPDVCECFAGYVMRNVSASEQTTTAATTNDADSQNKQDNAIAAQQLTPNATASSELELCQPVCSGGCAHGHCFAPEVCVCNVGYLMGANRTCEPVCTHGCHNARCIEPEICECMPGYQFANNSVSACVPNCTPSCIKGVCAAPNVCICWKQYQPKSVAPMRDGQLPQQHECEPICSIPCEHGNCVAPDFCRCHEGYVSANATDASNTRCMPHCVDCENGECVAPGKCVCWAEYELAPASGKCVSITTTTEATTTPQKLLESSTLPTTTTALIVPPTTVETAVEAASTLHTSTPIAVADSDASIARPVAADADFIWSSSCSAQCKCWEPPVAHTPLGETKCVYICADEYDEPCLNLSNCRCNAAQQQMRCNDAANDAATNATNVATPTLTFTLTYYTCKVHVPAVNVPLNDSSSLGYAPAQPDAAPTVPWLLIFGCIFGSLLSITIGLLAWRYHRLRYECGVQDVSLKHLFISE